MPAKTRNEQPAIVTIPVYLDAVERLHGIGSPEMARTLGVTVAAVRRWRRGQQVPSWRRVKALVARWGGDAELLGLGAALQRCSRETGLALEDAVKLVRSGRRTLPERRRPASSVARNQLRLPIGL
jgi:hypothetical protein